MIQIPPQLRQFIQRKLAGFCERGAGSDLHYLCQSIKILYSWIRRVKPDFKLTEDEWKHLEKIHLLALRVKSYEDDELIDKQDVSHPKFISYKTALSQISLIDMKLYDIFNKLFEMTNVIHMTIPHDYFVRERKEEKEFDRDQRHTPAMPPAPQED